MVRVHQVRLHQARVFNEQLKKNGRIRDEVNFFLETCLTSLTSTCWSLLRVWRERRHLMLFSRLKIVTVDTYYPTGPRQVVRQIKNKEDQVACLKFATLRRTQLTRASPATGDRWPVTSRKSQVASCKEQEPGVNYPPWLAARRLISPFSFLMTPVTQWLDSYFTPSSSFHCLLSRSSPSLRPDVVTRWQAMVDGTGNSCS